MSQFNANLNKREQKLIELVLSKSMDKGREHGAMLEWKEVRGLGFGKAPTAEQIRALTSKLLKQRVAFLVEKKHCKVDILDVPVLTKCRIMGDAKKGWTILFSVSPEVLERRVQSFDRIEAQNDLVARYKALAA